MVVRGMELTFHHNEPFHFGLVSHCMPSESPFTLCTRRILDLVARGGFQVHTESSNQRTSRFRQWRDTVSSLLDASCQREAVRHQGHELDKVDEGRDSVQHAKFLVESAHLIRLCILVIPLLSVSLGWWRG